MSDDLVEIIMCENAECVAAFFFICSEDLNLVFFSLKLSRVHLVTFKLYLSFLCFAINTS